MTPNAVILALFIIFNILLVALLRWRPQVTAGVGGKALAFLALFLLPVFTFSFSAAHHLEQATTTTFCLSCHVMEPYGRSLYIDSPDYVPASHFQNNRVPQDQACYTCHTTYAMFGDLRAKLNGIRHVYVNYLGTVPEHLALYEAYQNRECLHCHAGARTFEENDFHTEIRGELERNEFSCLDCHPSIHAVTELPELPMWDRDSDPTGGP